MTHHRPDGVTIAVMVWNQLRLRFQFRYRGSRRESAVAQLFSLGHFRVFDFDRAGFADDDCSQKNSDE